MSGTASPDDSVIFLQGSISASVTDSLGNVWTIMNGQVAENGLVDATTAGVVEMAYVAGDIWQENSAGVWWVQASGGGWTSPDGPDGTLSNPLSGTLPNIISAGTANTGTVDIGTVVEISTDMDPNDPGEPVIGDAILRVPAGVSDLILQSVTVTNYNLTIAMAAVSSETVTINGNSRIGGDPFAGLSVAGPDAFAAGPQLVNNGTMTISGGGVFADTVTGTGVITTTNAGNLGAESLVPGRGSIDAGETIQLSDGFLYVTGHTDAPITDLGPDSSVFLENVQATAEMFTKTGRDSGILSLYDGARYVESLSISGAPEVYAVPTSGSGVIISTRSGESMPVLSRPPHPTFDLAVQDTTTGEQLDPTASDYSGPDSELLEQFIATTTDNIDVTAKSADWYIRANGTMDAIAVSNGVNVLDGGSGSTFMTGGSGYDTFFIDVDQMTSNTWSTVVNFHAGDAIDFWGVSPGDFKTTWLRDQGAPGYMGATLVVTRPDGVEVGVTLAGAILTGRGIFNPSLVYGRTPDLPGLAGSAYMMYAPISVFTN